MGVQPLSCRNDDKWRINTVDMMLEMLREGEGSTRMQKICERAQADYILAHLHERD